MQIEIRLPKATGFDIEMDGQPIHSKYEDMKTSVFLKKGEHLLSANDQAPAPHFWGKIIGVLNPISQTQNNYSDEMNFEIISDLEVMLSIRYDECDRVEFVFDRELPEYLA